jgi:hypothetical protein
MQSPGRSVVPLTHTHICTYTHTYAHTHTPGRSGVPGGCCSFTAFFKSLTYRERWVRRGTQDKRRDESKSERKSSVVPL